MTRPPPAAARARAALVVPLAVAVALIGGACSRGADHPRAVPATSTTAPTAPAPVHVAVTATTIDGSDQPGDDVVAQVNAALDRYVAVALVAPLASGQPVGDLSPVFTAAAAAQIGADPALRATLLDEGMPPATREVSAPRAAAILSAVNDESGTPIVGARIGLTIHAVGPGLDVDIARDGEVVLVPDAGTWKIDVVNLRTARSSR